MTLSPVAFSQRMSCKLRSNCKSFCLPCLSSDEFVLTDNDNFRRFYSYFERLNCCIALLTPSLNSYVKLRNQPGSRFLLSAICAVSARFLWPDRCQDAFALAEHYVARFHRGDLAARLEHCQACSILSMWRLPADPTG